MKKINLIIVLIMFLFTVNSANAVVETSAYDNGTIEMFEKYFKPYEPPTQEQLEDELLEKQKNEKDDLLGNYNKSSGTLAPIKRLRMKYHYWQNHKSDPKVAKEEKVELLPEEKNQIILNCEEMEYFADRREIEANGNVSVYFPENEVTVKADRIVYNQDANIIKAFENVRIIKSTGEIDGDYLKIDMNEENSFMNNPVSALYQLKIISKKGYMYGDKIIQE